MGRSRSAAVLTSANTDHIRSISGTFWNLANLVLSRKAPVGDISGLTRAVILFDGNDAEAVEQARAGWKRFRAAGHEVSYFQQDESGRWQNRAAAR